MALASPKLRALAQRSASFEPVRDTQRTFRVLLDVMARPGTIQQLPVAAVAAPVNPWLAAVLVTLLDHEVSLAVGAFDGPDGLERFVRQRTACKAVSADRADFVVASWDGLDPSLPLRLRTGTLEYPNDGATLLLLVPTLAQDDPAALLLGLAGPGIPAGHSLRVPGLPAAFFSARDEAAEYPCGTDLILIDPDGRVAALPRSTTILAHDVPASMPASR